MNFCRRVNFFAVFFSFLMPLLSPINILAQAGKGSSGSGSSKNSSGDSSAKGQSAGSSASDQASAGISGGTIAIELTDWPAMAGVVAFTGSQQYAIRSVNPLKKRKSRQSLR